MLVGVVAKGAALSGATVSAKCASGSATATTASDGSYSMSIASAALPCVLEATSGSDTLHGVASGSGASATANITTLTELLVAQLTGQTPSTYYATASSLDSTVTSSAVTSAKASVIALLTSAGIDTSSLTDIVTGSLSAGSNTGYDAVLESLASSLSTTGTTLTDLTTTVAAATSAAASGEATTSTSESMAASLPADLLLKPKASNCDALRSTTYRLIKFAPSTDTGATAEVSAIDRFSMDASTLVMTNTASASDTLALTTNGSCRYSATAGGGGQLDMVVAPSGVIVIRALLGTDDDTVASSARGSWRMVVGLPEQTHTVGELAGTWNYMNWQPSEADSSVWTVEAGDFTVNSSGSWTASTCNSTIAADPANPTCTATGTEANNTYSVHASGGFRLNTIWSGADHYSRVFAYRTGSGSLLLVGINPEGQPTFATRQRSASLPATGATWNARNITVNSSLIAADATQLRSFAVASVNSSDTSNGSTGSYVRNVSDTGSTTTVPQTLYMNSGGTGYTYRPQASVTDSTGAAATVRVMHSLPLTGTGLSAYWNANTSTTGNNSRFGLGVK